MTPIGTGSREKETKRDDLQFLLARQFGEGREEQHAPKGHESMVRLRDNPAYREALNFLATQKRGELAPPTEGHGAGRQPTASQVYLSFSHRDAHAALEKATRAFYTHFEDEAYRLWRDNLLGQLLARPEGLLRPVVRTLVARIASLEKRVESLEAVRTGVPTLALSGVAAIEPVSALSGKIGKAHNQRSLTESLVQLGEYLPSVASAFKDAFGVEKVSVSAEASADEESLPLTVVVDATDSDAKVVAAARADGARAAFYDRIAGTLPSRLLDLTDFELRFPGDASV